MTLNERFPKTDIAKHRRYLWGEEPEEREFESLDAAWETNVAHADHGDTLNLTDTTLEPTLQQLEALLSRIGGGLRRLTLSGVFSRMIGVNRYISKVFVCEKPEEKEFEGLYIA